MTKPKWQRITLARLNASPESDDVQVMRSGDEPRVSNRQMGMDGRKATSCLSNSTPEGSIACGMHAQHSHRTRVNLRLAIEARDLVPAKYKTAT